MAPDLLDTQKETFSSQLKAAKLAAVEKLLWGTAGGDPAASQQPAGILLTCSLLGFVHAPLSPWYPDELADMQAREDRA